MDDVNHSAEFLLFDRYLSGDKNAGEELFSSVYPNVKKYVFSKTKNDLYLNESDKEDIITEAMMRVLDKQYLFNGHSKFSSFVIGFAKNIILEKRKKIQKQVARTIEYDDVFRIESINFYDDPINIIIRKEQLEVVHKSLEILPEEQRTVLILRILNNMPFKQVSEISGKTNDAVDSLFRRALVAFKKNYEKIYCSRDGF